MDKASLRGEDTQEGENKSAAGEQPAEDTVAGALANLQVQVTELVVEGPATTPVVSRRAEPDAGNQLTLEGWKESLEAQVRFHGMS